MNLKRISELERMARMTEEETEKRERRSRELSAKYKVDLRSSCSLFMPHLIAGTAVPVQFIARDGRREVGED